MFVLHQNKSSVTGPSIRVKKRDIALLRTIFGKVHVPFAVAMRSGVALKAAFNMYGVLSIPPTTRVEDFVYITEREQGSPEMGEVKKIVEFMLEHPAILQVDRLTTAALKNMEFEVDESPS